MLKREQVLASEWGMLELDELELRLMEAFPEEPGRRLESKNALHFYDAFLGITDATIDTAFTPKFLTAFKGFLATEFDIPKAESAALVWAVGELYGLFGLLNEQDIQFSLSQDDAFVKRAYQKLMPLPERIKYYTCWFKVSCGHLFFDLRELNAKLSESSQQFLRDRLTDYLKDKNLYEAQTDAALICSILQGHVSRWPGRELNKTISSKQTSIFIKEIRLESNRQTAFAGFTRADTRKNLELIMNVIAHLFIRSGIFTDVGSLESSD